MLDWHYDEQGAIANMVGIENPMFTVSRALSGKGFVAVESFPVGLRIIQPVDTLDDGVAWCEAAAQQCLHTDPPSALVGDGDSENTAGG